MWPSLCFERPNKDAFRYFQATTSKKAPLFVWDKAKTRGKGESGGGGDETVTCTVEPLCKDPAYKGKPVTKVIMYQF